MESCVSVRSKKVWNDYKERTAKKENDCDHIVEGDAVEIPVVCVCREQALQALNENRKSPRTFRSIIGVDCR